MWNRQAASTEDGRILRGYVAHCLVPVEIPTDAPAALQMVAMDARDGADCPAWIQYSGQAEFYEDSDEDTDNG